jgi:hypothetical protein
MLPTLDVMRPYDAKRRACPQIVPPIDVMRAMEENVERTGETRAGSTFSFLGEENVERPPDPPPRSTFAATASRTSSAPNPAPLDVLHLARTRSPHCRS